MATHDTWKMNVRNSETLLRMSVSQWELALSLSRHWVEQDFPLLTLYLVCLTNIAFLTLFCHLFNCSPAYVTKKGNFYTGWQKKKQLEFCCWRHFGNTLGGNCLKANIVSQHYKHSLRYKHLYCYSKPGFAFLEDASYTPYIWRI